MDQKPAKRPGMTMEVLDREAVWAERECDKYAHYTLAERILFGEELRVACYGESLINTRFQGSVEVLERVCR